MFLEIFNDKIRKRGNKMRYHSHMLSSFTGAVALSHVTHLPVGLALTGGVILGSLLPDIDEPNSYIGKKTSVSVTKGGATVGPASIVKGLFGHRGFTHSLLAAFLVFIPYLLLRNQHEFLGIDLQKSNLLQQILSGTGSWLALSIMMVLIAYFIYVFGSILVKVAKKIFSFLSNKNKKRIKFSIYIALILITVLMPLNWMNAMLLGVSLGYLLHIMGDFLSKSGVPLLYPFTKKRFKIYLYTTGKISETIVLIVILVGLGFMTDKSLLQWFVWK